ncbi:MAG: DUF721 domain-containing protein [Muribaculaceae bacterium]|nr:DUF721 domain-containing protein [Muribaculaceae bacterium]MDE6703888.1 DUF721 domain-containing protein [Muribaculaceae bacterium]
MKRSDAKTFGEIFNEAMTRTGMSDVYDEQRAAFLWTEIVGATVNRLTTRRYIADGVLHVYISSAPLKSELNFLVETLRERINEAVGHPVVKSIIIH